MKLGAEFCNRRWFDTRDMRLHCVAGRAARHAVWHPTQAPPPAPPEVLRRAAGTAPPPQSRRRLLRPRPPPGADRSVGARAPPALLPQPAWPRRPGGGSTPARMAPARIRASHRRHSCRAKDTAKEVHDDRNRRVRTPRESQCLLFSTSQLCLRSLRREKRYRA